MADTGYRSIEMFISNDTEADLTVQNPTLDRSCSWIPGEEAEQGMLVEEFQTVIWGALTEDAGGSVSGSVELSGFGRSPVRVGFSNSSSGQRSVIVTPNDKVRGAVEEIESEEENHSQFRVNLQPV